MSLDRASLGPRSPLVETPARLAGSVRRTSTVDTTRPGRSGADRMVEARARDLRTGGDGATVVLGRTTLVARVDPRTYELAEAELDPVDPHLSPLVSDLVGATVGPGFRRRLSELLTSPEDRTSLAYLLLDDLPGAQLVAGYDVHHRAPGDAPHDLMVVAAISARADTCAGWARGGSLLAGFERTAEVPTPVGPLAPTLESTDDEASWHDIAPLPAGAMRRRRRLDVFAGEDGRHRFESHFRDSHMSDEGDETILHEYRLRGEIDDETRTLVTVEPEALVLPYVECPNALGSAGEVIGWSIGDLRRNVHRELTGVTTCTHLNDTLRALCDLDVLVAELER